MYLWFCAFSELERHANQDKRVYYRSTTVYGFTYTCLSTHAPVGYKIRLVCRCPCRGCQMQHTHQLAFNSLNHGGESDSRFHRRWLQIVRNNPCIPVKTVLVRFMSAPLCPCNLGNVCSTVQYNRLRGVSKIYCIQPPPIIIYVYCPRVLDRYRVHPTFNTLFPRES